MIKPQLKVNPRFETLLTFVLLIASSALLFGQISEQQLVHYDIEDGLPSKVIYSVQQDSSGFIWISTDVGITLFDGHSFRTFTTKDGLPSNDVIDVDYVGGRLWINSLGPLSYITDGSFAIEKAPPISSVNFTSFIDHEFALDGDNLWISRANEIYLVDNNTLEQKPLPAEIYEDSIYNWVFEHNGAPWLLRQKSGRSIELLQITGNQINKKFNIKTPSKHSHLFSYVSKGNHLFYTFRENLFVIDTDTGKEKLIVNVKDLGSTLTINGDELWVVQPRYGIDIYQLVGDTAAVHQKTILTGLQPSRVFFDREDNAWISTLGNGLYFFPKQAKSISVLQKGNGLDKNTINSVHVSNDVLISGNRNNLLEYFAIHSGKLDPLEKRQLAERPDFSIANRVLKIVEARPGKYFFATDAGLVYLHEDEEEIILRGAIKNLYFGRTTGDLFISTHRRVSKISSDNIDNILPKASKGNPTKIVEPILDGRSYASAIDFQGHIWVHSIPDGLVQITPTDTILWKERDPIFSAQAMDITILQDSTVCIGTKGNGLILIKNNEVRAIDQESLLASNFINVLRQDTNGGLWIGTNKGVTNWPTPSFKDEGVNLVTYSKSDGLLSNHINDLAVFKDQVFIATNEGIMYFSPNDIINASDPPNLIVFPPVVNDTFEITTATRDLKPKENNIQFRFAALNYQNRNTTTFFYRLNGLNDNWQSTKTPEVRFIGLQPGNYAFELKAVTDKGLETKMDPAFTFTIERPFVQSPAFYLIIACAVLGILYLFVQNIIRYAKNKELNRLVQEKTKALKQQNDELEFSNTKLRRSNQELNQFAYVASHDLKSPLRNISSFVQLLRRRAQSKLNEVELEYIDFAVKGTLQLGKLIDDLQAYSQITGYSPDREVHKVSNLVKKGLDQLPELSEEGVVSIHSDLPKVRINTQNGRLLFYHLLSNASKFRDSERPLAIEIGATRHNGLKCLYVKDNGIGINPQYQDKIFKIFQRLHTTMEYPGTGIGLAICKKVIQEEGGQIWLSSEEGKGATFYFTMQFD